MHSIGGITISQYIGLYRLKIIVRDCIHTTYSKDDILLVFGSASIDKLYLSILSFTRIDHGRFSRQDTLVFKSFTRIILQNNMPYYFPFAGIKCTHPLKYRKGKFQNGNVSSSDPEFSEGATLLFECNEGYELKGSDTMTCLEVGWRPSRPYCLGKRFLFESNKKLKSISTVNNDDLAVLIGLIILSHNLLIS